MRFGLFQSAQWPHGTSQSGRLRDAVAQSVLAETLGFDVVFMTEHHFSRHGIVPDNLAMLAHLAAQTRTIRLGTGVSVLPLHEPLRLAESAALVDVLSGGRLEFGIGRGYQWGEFDGFGVSLDERAARFDESIDLILRAWTSDAAISHAGRYWEYRDARPEPRPLQQPHPPVWMATTSTDGFERCVRHGWGVMLPQAVPLATVAGWVEAYRAVVENHGGTFDGTKLILARGLHLGRDETAGWAEGGPAYVEFLRLAQQVAAAPGGGAAPLAFDIDNVRDTALIGGAAACIDKLAAIRDLGIGTVIVFSNMGGIAHEDVVASLRRFAEEVIPAFR